VEVAAYRIILGAFTNIIKHAQASRCDIQIHLKESVLKKETALWIELTDDGVGISEAHNTGVGLSSIRERAGELGGECSVEQVADGGTRVQARLPIARG
jgi:signal transduction histidine kinase